LIRSFANFKSTPFLLSISLTIGSLLLAGCIQNRKGTILIPKITASSATSATSYPITITKVVLNQSDPAGTFDVLGNGSNSIGNYCQPLSASDTTGATTCSCVFDYNYTDPATGATSTQQLMVDTSYREGDMVRCPYGQIPSAITAVGVSLATKDNKSKSNTISFGFGTGTGILDTSQTYTFSRIFRFTCRQKIYVPNSLDLASGIYDPFQSEGDPSNSYPVSFYTSNLGASLNAFAGGATGAVISDYECPSDLRHPGSAYAETIYSTAAGPDGKFVISGNPGAGTVDMNIDNPRSTFYLSKVRTGVFTINVNAYIAPYLISQAQTTPNPQGGGLPSLGWGASPRSTGSGTETCPSDSPTDGAGHSNPDYVTIPSGYHWVKVWLFRMALPARQYLLGANLQRLGGVGCNPGKWPILPDPGNVNNIYNSEVPDCFGLAALGEGGTAARFSPGMGMCFRPGTWTPNGKDTNYSCGMPKQVDFSNPYSSSNLGGLNVCDGAGHATNATPFDSAPVAKYLDNPSSIRYEFLFVVTPKTVNTGDMSNSASPVYAQYAPFRFRVDSDCNSTHPGGCPTQYMFRNYGLKLHDVADAGDPPASNPSRAGVFPICALQPDSVLGTGL
jgi:hypothetical protein